MPANTPGVVHQIVRYTSTRVLILGFALVLGVSTGTSVDAIGTSTPPNFLVAFIGDQNLGPDPEAILQLISDEAADMVLHQGDFDYGDDPDAWDAQANTILGPSLTLPPWATMTNWHGRDTSKSFLTG